MSYLHEVRIVPELVAVQHPRSPKTYGQPLVRNEDIENDFGAIDEAVMTAKKKGSLRDFHVLRGKGEEIVLQPYDRYADMRIGLLMAGIIYTHQIPLHPEIKQGQDGFTEIYKILSPSGKIKAGAIQAQYHREQRDTPTVLHQVRHSNHQRTPTYS